MKYIKLTFQYFLKHWYVLLFAIVPGVLLGVLTDPTSIFGYIARIKPDTSYTFGEIFKSATEMSWKGFFIGIAIVPIVAIFISAICGVESKHMRLGIKDFKSFFKRVNNNILFVLFIGLIFLIGLELIGVLFVSFALLWSKIFQRYTLLIAMNCITAGVLMLTLILLVAFCIIWLPTMTITGLNPKKALGQTIVNVRGKKLWGLFLAVALPLIPVYAIMCICDYYIPKYAFIFNMLGYIFMIEYFVTLMYVAYCDICDIDREDKKGMIDINYYAEKEENNG